jgi:hypothetical protein
MSGIEITQDVELDPDVGLGQPMPVFWAHGHGHDEHDFLLEVVGYCLEYGVGIPRIDADVAPVEVWQENVEARDAVEYRRTTQPPTRPNSDLFPITLLDLEFRQRGGTKCAVIGCREPWLVGAPVSVAVEPNEGDGVSEPEHMAVRIWFCAKHSRRLPEPSYRVRFVPVGATIVLPKASEVFGQGVSR